MKANHFGVAALSLASAAALAGCASSTGILPAGPDTYTVSNLRPFVEVATKRSASADGGK
jgi:hypothetical protein